MGLQHYVLLGLEFKFIFFCRTHDPFYFISEAVVTHSP